MTSKATEAPISVSGFALHSTRQSLARFLARYELFKLQMEAKAALESFLPRMSRGAVVAVDEINSARWPGETQALLETIDLKRHSIRRFTMDPNIGYIVL